MPGPSHREASRRAQTETLGVVLILGIATVGTGMVVMFGSAALDDTQRTSELQNAAHVMTLFDSRAAQVALGGSSVQSVSFGQLSGSYRVNSTAGHITIQHEDWDDAGSVETIYDADLGALVYESDDTTIVYQGGGVWRKRGVGNATMVSPPEFHYREATLTLPVVRVAGSDSVSGRVTAKVREGEKTSLVFPNESTHYDGDPTNEVYHNPASSGKLRVTVQSEYYRAWAEYFRTRTTGTVTVFDANRTVKLELVSTGQTGHFDMPGEGSAVPIRGVGGHAVDDYTVTLRPDDADSANFANLKWSMFVEEGDTEFEIHVRKTGGTGCSLEASATVYYSDDGGSTYQGWYDDDAFTAECGDYNGDGDDEVRLVLDVVDAGGSDPLLEYRSLSNSELEHFSPNGGITDPVTLDGHGAAWEPEDYNASNGETQTIDRLVSHYFSEMGSFELTVDDKNGDTVNEGASTGNIDYDGGGRYITFLHVTENEITVELD